MGLLDQILGAAVGGALGRRSPLGRTSPGGGKARLVMLLLPVLLQVLANRRRGAGFGGGTVAAGRGGVLSGGFGGLGELLEQLTRRGFGKQAQSWVATGPNDPLPQPALDVVLEPQELSALAAEAGVGEDEAREVLAEVLPEVVDRLTPEGRLPGQDQLLASIDEFERRLPSA